MARLNSFLKRHPSLRRRAQSAYIAAARGLARSKRPFRPSFSRPELIRDTPSWTAEWNRNHRRQSTIRWIREAEEIHNRPPRSVHGFVDDEYVMAAEVTVPPAFVASIPGGRVVGQHGAVVTPDGKLLLDVSWPMPSLRKHMLDKNRLIPGGDQFFVDASLPARRINGTVAVLSAYAGSGYFHWLWDVIPRLGLIKDSGIDLDSIDAFAVPSYMPGFQIETLTELGLGRSRIINTFKHRHLQATHLLVPSLTRPTGVVPTWAADYLLKVFPPSKPRGSFSQRIYVTRKYTDHGLLEEENRLTADLSRRGFTPLAMEDFTVREKAWLFGQAEAILGPSGAGLCNIVFCRPGTKVVEIRVQPYPVMEAWDIANRRGLDFYDILPIGYHAAKKDVVTSGRVRAEDIFATLDLAGL
jgi:capsular polysaccharide biosynthesis protein